MGIIKKCDIIDGEIIGYTFYGVCDMCEKESPNSFKRIKIINKKYELCDDCIDKIENIIDLFIEEW